MNHLGNICNINGAEVEPVVRGEWVKHADGGTDENGYWHETPYYVCSNCGRVVTSTTVRCHGCFAHMKRSDPRAETNQVDRCTTCDNNGKPICSSCIMTGHGNDIDFYRAATEPKGGLDGK